MKKILSLILVCVLMVGALTSCFGKSVDLEAYAKEINDAAEDEKYITLEEIEDKFGDDAIVDVDKDDNGIVTVIEGKSAEEAEEYMEGFENMFDFDDPSDIDIDEIKEKLEELAELNVIIIEIEEGNAEEAYAGSLKELIEEEAGMDFDEILEQLEQMEDMLG